MKKSLSVPLSLSMFLVACVITGDVLPIGNGLYTVSASADGYRTGTAARDAAIKTAIKYCEKQGKSFEMQSDEMKNTRMHIDTTANITFKCVG